MHFRKVILNFVNDTITIGNQSIPATKVLMPEMDDCVWQYWTTERKQEWLHSRQYAACVEEVLDEEPQVQGGVLGEGVGTLLQLNEEYIGTLKWGQVDTPVPKSM